MVQKQCIRKLSTLTDKIRMWDIHILKREGAELSYSEKEVTGCAIFTSEYSEANMLMLMLLYKSANGALRYSYIKAVIQFSSVQSICILSFSSCARPGLCIQELGMLKRPSLLPQSYRWDWTSMIMITIRMNI